MQANAPAIARYIHQLQNASHRDVRNSMAFVRTTTLAQRARNSARSFLIARRNISQCYSLALVLHEQRNANLMIDGLREIASCAHMSNVFRMACGAG
jgi:hypothetical protein